MALLFEGSKSTEPSVVMVGETASGDESSREARLADCRARLGNLAFAARRLDPIDPREVHALVRALRDVIDPEDGQARVMIAVLEAMADRAAHDPEARRRCFHACRGLLERHAPWSRPPIDA